MAQTLVTYDGRLWLLSCGNERTNGQVLVGDTNRPHKIRFDKLGLCTGLPSPYLQEPGLLEPDEEKTAASCAVLAQQEAQSLMVNRLVAAFRLQSSSCSAILALSTLSAIRYFNCNSARHSRYSCAS